MPRCTHIIALPGEPAYKGSRLFLVRHGPSDTQTTVQALYGGYRILRSSSCTLSHVTRRFFGEGTSSDCRCQYRASTSVQFVRFLYGSQEQCSGP